MLRIISYSLNILFFIVFFSFSFNNPIRVKIEKFIIGNYTKQRHFDINRHYSLVFVEDLSDEKKIFCKKSSFLNAAVKVKNASPFYLVSSKDVDANLGGGVNLSYRIFDALGQNVILEGNRHYFEKALAPFDGVEFTNVPITCPGEAGLYQIEIALVQEGVNWQSQLPVSSNWIKKTLTVIEDNEIDQSLISSIDEDFSALILKEKEKEILTKSFNLAKNMITLSAQTFIQNEKSFLISYAGSIYPMVWVRDMASIQKAYHILNLKKNKQSHFSELFFEVQSLSGSIPDWVRLNQDTASSSRSGKNTIQSDQELWLIYSVLNALKDGDLDLSWFNKKTAGLTHLQRLINAWSFILEKKFDEKNGCVFSGHIADWGDVGLKGDHEKTSTKLEHNPERVCGIFLQSLFVIVADQFLNQKDIFSSDDLSKDMLLKIEKAKNAAANYASSLWNEKKGFYSIHRHLDPIEHKEPAGIKEQDLFVLGGNLFAIKAFTLEKERNKKVVEAIKEHLLKGYSIGTTIIPPYPRGTFENPIMDEPFKYQNGADWDWFGARAVSILYPSDQHLAQKAILDIASRAVLYKGFYEWYDQSNKPQGSSNFQASAAEFLNMLAHLEAAKITD